MNKIEIVVGDWSGDGHNKKASFYVETLMTSNQVKEFYQDASIKLGFDLLRYCDKYNTIPEYILTPILKQINIDPLHFEINDIKETEENGYYYLTEYDFVKIYIRMVEYVSGKSINIIIADTINIGGYGFFSY